MEILQDILSKIAIKFTYEYNLLSWLHHCEVSTKRYIKVKKGGKH